MVLSPGPAAVPTPPASPPASPPAWLPTSPERLSGAALTAQVCTRPGCSSPCADVADWTHPMYGYCSDECWREQARVDRERRIQEGIKQGIYKVRKVVRQLA